PTNVIGNLEQRTGEGAQYARAFDDFIQRALRLEVIARLVDDNPRLRRKQLQHLGCEVRARVDAGPDSGAAERHFAQTQLRMLQSLDGIRHLSRVSVELLPEANRRRVLQVSPTSLY